MIVDPSPSSCVGVCECGARFLGRDRLAVLVFGARHEAIAHPRTVVWRKSLIRERHAAPIATQPDLLPVGQSLSA